MSLLKNHSKIKQENPTLFNYQFKNGLGQWTKRREDWILKDDMVVSIGKGTQNLSSFEYFGIRPGEILVIKGTYFSGKGFSVILGVPFDSASVTFSSMDEDKKHTKITIETQDYSFPQPRVETVLQHVFQKERNFTIEIKTYPYENVSALKIEVVINGKSPFGKPIEVTPMGDSLLTLTAQNSRVGFSSIELRGEKRAFSDTLTVGCFQMINRPDLERNTLRIIKAVREASRTGIDVLLTPETAHTSLISNGTHPSLIPDYVAKLNPEKVRQEIRKIAAVVREEKIWLILGTTTWENIENRQGLQMLNTSIVFNRQGRETFRYSKAKICEPYFAPGENYAFFHIEGIPCTMYICHDARYPELVRLPIMMGARIVFHPQASIKNNELPKKKNVPLDDWWGLPSSKDKTSLKKRVPDSPKPCGYADVFYVGCNAIFKGYGVNHSVICDPYCQILATTEEYSVSENSSEEIPKEKIIKAKLRIYLASGNLCRRSWRMPQFLTPYWTKILKAIQQNVAQNKTRREF